MSHLLVFGASGISGWAVTCQALRWPTKDTFRQVTGLTNRPVDRADSRFPEDERLQLASGIDLTGSVDSIVQGLKTKVHNASTITHVIFTAYIEKTDRDELVSINTLILRNAIQAVEQVAPDLKSVVLQTGGKGYGFEFPDEIELKPPMKESYERIPDKYKIFYYSQYDTAKQLSEGKSWSFAEIRPDVIVGFTPGANFMNASQGLAFYLTLYREKYGEGAAVPFVGTPKSWTNKHTDTWQDILAQTEIWAALNQDKIGDGASFNTADGDVTTWQEKWPALCSYFGLKGEGPGDHCVDFAKFARENQEVWEKLEAKHGLREGIFAKYSWGFMTGILVFFDFDRQYDLGALQSAGFPEKNPTTLGWTTSFDRLREAKVIP